MAPGWMPRYSDNLPVFRQTMEDYSKSEDYELLDPELHQVFSQIYAGVLLLEAEKAQEQAQAQAAQAEGMGMANAAKPQGMKPLPSLPSLSNGSNQS